MDKAKILIVEDESIVAMDLAGQLRDLGYEVTGVAGAAQEAIAHAQAAPPDVALVDIVLPGDMDGIELAKWFREQLGVPVVFLTAYSDDDMLRRAKIAEPYGYIVKPFDSRDLKSNIEIALYKHAMERRLAESELCLATTLRNIGDAVIAADAADRVKYMNPVAEHLTAWTGHEAKGRPLAEVCTIVNRQNEPQTAVMAAKARRQRSPVRSTTAVHLLARDGRRVPTDYSLSPILDTHGHVTGLVVCCRDITEQVRLEEELRQSAKMDAIGKLAGGIAHDFNNLLTGILGYAELLHAEAEPGSTVHEAAKTIRSAANRAAELTQKLLGFARKGKHQVMPVDVHDIMHDVVALLGRVLDQRVRLTLDFQAEKSTVMGDPTQMQQIFMNLAVNARDAMPEGGDLSFHSSAVSLDDTARVTRRRLAPGDYLAIEVVDTGCGMPDDVLERIFDPFFTTKSAGEGIGLGLSMVYGIIENHGGSIDVTSQCGHGTTFTVLLPLNDQRLAQVEAEEAREHHARDTHGCILLVDDEPVVRMAAGRMIERLGYEVVVATGGQEAADYYRQHADRVALAIIDMAMPGMDGRECFRAMRQVNPHVRAILSSGYGQDGRAQEILDDGILCFVQKPFRMQELADAIEKALGSA
ncbi:response regulator [bacterium]|nr:response regulator [bacterium]